VNLVDFDMIYGHRQDADGYAKALSEFDLWLGAFLSKLEDDDMLIITADHGCDPGDDSTDHTREYTPLLVFGKKIEAENFGTKAGFGTISNLISRSLGIEFFSQKCDEIELKWQ
jgi:phosphopentomutase